ncbi:hypothetical protein [Nonomuraea wenchangensis]|uniref:Uncharacterized protein n=1 Tax=Nonomuraea wenchangensis TaxID=568860 RepID=A0A1I0IWS2_9ACTN|nr:hypothetical protein [Nonomuraea wenchangensis]SEU01107.1 hypothetical protein SAMN05421811_105214 [Nonomuraea wenchangensis]
MPEGFETRVSWPFECLRCLHVWEEDYLLRTVIDARGNETQIWLSSGVAVQPPWSGPSCPGCGAYRVTSFPSGYLSRHPELVAAQEPDPGPVRVPGIKPPDRVAAVQRATLPGRLLVALGMPIALFVGYELYAAIVKPVHH